MVEAASRFKQAVLLIFKILLAALLIFWLIRSKKLDFSALGGIHFNLPTVFLFFCAGLFVFLGLTLLGLRLWLLLRSRGCPINYNKVLGFTFIGSFFGAVLPGLIGGDAVRAIYLCGNLRTGKAEAVMAVLADRILGVYSLLLLGSIALVFACLTGATVALDPLLLAAAPSAVLFLSFLWVAFIHEGIFKSGPAEFLFRRLPAGIPRVIQVLRDYLKDARLVGILVLISLANHALVVGSFVICALLLKDPVAVYQHFVVDPLAMMMNMLMITPGGAGITEGVFALLYSGLGSSNGALIGLLGRILQYGVFIITGSAALLSLKVIASAQKNGSVQG